MSFQSTAPKASGELAHHPFSFKGTGGEYFKIWIVNLVLSILTLGIFSAWAKVRRRRYFYGNTQVAGQGFEYHASPWRILLGRIIALILFLGYTLSKFISPIALLAAALLLLIAIPWLIVSSLRFNARNSSYRNVRFHFNAGYWQAFKVYYLWPLLAYVTLLTTIPLAHRAHQYFYVNNHTFGGQAFHTRIPGVKMYLIHAIVYVPLIALGAAAVGYLIPMLPTLTKNDPAAINAAIIPLIPFFIGIYLVLIFGAVAIQVLVFNITINHMKLAERHEFRSTLSVFGVIWIAISNLVLVVLTLGLFTPWAHVRMVRYQFEHLELIAASDLSEFSSEAAMGSSAIGEEVASFFDLDFGL